MVTEKMWILAFLIGACVATFACDDPEFEVDGISGVAVEGDTGSKSSADSGPEGSVDAGNPSSTDSGSESG
jgi:hypothetical protein